MSMSLEHDYIGFSSEVVVPPMDINTSHTSIKTISPCSTTSNDAGGGGGLNLKATELRLGLPGSDSPQWDNGNNNNKDKSFVSGAKRGFSVAIHSGSGKVLKDGLLHPQSPEPVVQENKSQVASASNNGHGVSAAPASKAQVVGWPPIRSFRKNTMASHLLKNDDDAETKMGLGCLYVKVSMDGAPYLRKVDLKMYGSYMELSSALEKMFSCFTIGQCGSHGGLGRDGLSETRLTDLLHGSEYVLTYEDKDGDWMLVGDVPWKMFTDSCRRLRIMKGSEAIGLAPRALEKSKTGN